MRLRGRATICSAVGKNDKATELRQIADWLEDYRRIKQIDDGWREGLRENKEMEPREDEECKTCECIICTSLTQSQCIFGNPCRRCLVANEHKPIEGCPQKRERQNSSGVSPEEYCKEKCGECPVVDYPQDAEPNEYRYIETAWLDEIAKGLTAGAVKHPGETWRTIPTKEHLFRAMRHISMWLLGDRQEPHITNASMRLMMAFATMGESGGNGHD